MFYPFWAKKDFKMICLTNNNSHRIFLQLKFILLLYYYRFKNNVAL